MMPLSNLKRLLSNPAVAVLAIALGGPIAYRFFKQGGDGWIPAIGITLAIIAICKNTVERQVEDKRRRDFDRRWDDM